MIDTRSGRLFLCGAVFALPLAAYGQIDPAVAGEAMVRLAPGTDADAFAVRFGVDCVVMQRVSMRDTYVLSIPLAYQTDTPGSTPSDFIDTLVLSQPETIWTELNYVHDAPEASGRNFFLNQVGSPIPFLDQAIWTQIGLPGAQAVSRGAGVLVAVVDTGVDAGHPLLAGRVAPGGMHFPGGALPPNGDTMDAPGGEMSGHGTHVAGLLAHVAPEVQILPIRALDSDGFTDSFRVAAAMYHAIDSGAAVINMSLGSTYKAQALEDAAAEAISRGIIVVAAAGNMNVQQPEEYPAFIEQGVISVGAVNGSDIRSPFSNFGPELMISAPGSGIFGPIPGDMYAQWDGTSFATPLVAGVAAMLVARDAAIAPADETRVARVGAAIRASAVNIDVLNPQYAGLLGGRLDAARALTTRVVFEAGASYASGGPLSEAGLLADFNGDYAIDAVVANSGGSTVGILLNDGAGVLSAATLVATGAGPNALAAADFSGDGVVDVAVSNGNGGAVSVLINGGSGAFVARAPFGVPSAPNGLAAADFDGDGFADLAVTSEMLNRITVLWNAGGTGFVTGPTLAVGAQPVDIVAADFDADLDVDLATVNRDSNSVTVWRYVGSRTFGGVTTHAVGLEPRGIATADFDSDGRADIATMNRDTDNVSVLWNTGAGFSFQQSLPLNGTGNAEAIAVVDADCDGRPDLAVIESDVQSGVLRVLLNQGARAFGAAAAFLTPGGGTAIVAGDVDGDDDQDLGLVQNSGQLTVLWNQACIPLAAGDANCDGRVTFFDIDPFVVAIVTPELYSTMFPECNILSADMNGDGRANFLDIDAFVERLFP